MKLEISEKFEAYLPRLTPQEFSWLETSIRNEGIKTPIETWNGVIVDGHNRYDIAVRYEIPFNVIERDFDDEDDVVIWMIKNQKARRNLSDERQSYYDGELYNLEKRKRGAPAGNRNAEKQSAQSEHFVFDEENENIEMQECDHKSENIKGKNCPLISQEAELKKAPKKTAEKHAKESSKSASTIRRNAEFTLAVNTIAKNTGRSVNNILDIAECTSKSDILKIARMESEEQKTVIAKIENGEVKNVTQAVKRKQIEQAKQYNKFQTQAIPEKPTLYIGDGIDWINQQEPCDLLLTDPPYMTDVEDIESFVLDWLPVALSKVKTTGFAFIFIGAYPDEVQAYLNAKSPPNVELCQLLVWTYKNTLGNNPRDRYKQNYQNILFYRGVDAPDIDCPVTNEQWAVMDVNAPDGRQGNRFHSWQKPMELAERLIRHTSKHGDTVYDPFACTGTFLLAANKLGRKGTGAEINEENAKIAIERGVMYG